MWLRTTHDFSTKKSDLSTGDPMHVHASAWQGPVSTEQLGTSWFVRMFGHRLPPHGPVREQMPNDT
jgi:hypothetical protein